MDDSKDWFNWMVDHHDCHISPSWCLIEARCLDIAHAWEEDRTAVPSGWWKGERWTNSQGWKVNKFSREMSFYVFFFTGYILTQPMDPEKKAVWTAYFPY